MHRDTDTGRGARWILAWVALLLLALAAAPALAESPAIPTPPPREAKVYLNGLDGGALVPTPPYFAPCLTDEQKAELQKLNDIWRRAYDKALAAVDDYVLDQYVVGQYENELKRASEVEVEAAANLAMASAREAPAAREAWEKARAAKQAAATALDKERADLVEIAADVRETVGVLRASRQAFIDAQAKMKPACPPPPSTSSIIPPQSSSSALAAAVLAELNFARTHPADYAETLKAGLPSPAQSAAISFLQALSPVPALQSSAALQTAAGWQVDFLAPLDHITHVGPDGSTPMARMQRAGVPAMLFAEEIAPGASTASSIVRNLVLDEGYPNAPHRADLFNPLFIFAGVGYGPQTAFGTVCVIDMSGKLLER